MAIYDFSRLNIYHSVPELRIDMLLSLIDETIAGMTCKSSQIILIESEFVISGENIRTFFLIIPDPEFMGKFVNAIEDARKQMYEK